MYIGLVELKLCLFVVFFCSCEKDSFDYDVFRMKTKNKTVALRLIKAKHGCVWINMSTIYKSLSCNCWLLRKHETWNENILRIQSVWLCLYVSVYIYIETVKAICIIKKKLQSNFSWWDRNAVKADPLFKKEVHSHTSTHTHTFHAIVKYTHRERLWKRIFSHTHSPAS